MKCPGGRWCRARGEFTWSGGSWWRGSCGRHCLGFQPDRERFAGGFGLLPGGWLSWIRFV